MDGEDSSKRRLASVYTWLMLGWGAFAPVVVLPRTWWDGILLSPVMLAIGTVFCAIAFCMGIYGMVKCSGMRRRFVVPVLLASPPLVVHLQILL